jgi:hypothetical protein
MSSKSIEDQLSPLHNKVEMDFLGINRNTDQAAQTAGLPSARQFSSGSVMPEWLQRFDELSNTADVFGATTSDSVFMGGTWGFSEDPLWNIGVWEDWDLNPGELGNLNFSGEEHISPSIHSLSAGNHQQLESPANREPKYEPVKTCETSSKVDNTPNDSSDIAGGMRASASCGDGRRPPGKRSSLLSCTSGPPVNYVGGNISSGRIRGVRDATDQLSVKFVSAISDLKSPSKSPDQFAINAATSSPQSDDQNNPPIQANRIRSRKDTERHYRLRLNEKFSALLKALPTDLVVSASGYPGGTQGDSFLTKVEILTLAKIYIATLEKAQAELTEESLVLRAQQELFKRLFEDLGGN